MRRIWFKFPSQERESDRSRDAEIDSPVGHETGEGNKEGRGAVRSPLRSFVPFLARSLDVSWDSVSRRRQLTRDFATSQKGKGSGALLSQPSHFE